MEIALLIIGIFAGIAIGWLIKNGESKTLKAHLASEQENAQQKASLQRSHYEQMLAEAKDNAAKLVTEEKASSERMRKESDRQWELKFEALKQDLLKTSAEQLMRSGEELRKTNDSNISDLLKPVKEQFEAFKKAVDDSRTQSEVSKKSIEDRFAETLKVFQLQQEHAIRDLKTETSKIGNDAVALAKALKSESKRQGNWGEMVLQTMLENSGLEEGVHFFVQYSVNDAEGNRNIPDVVVKFPEGRSVIIDSKVSLKAYTEYFETEDIEKQNMLLKAHLASVEKHVDELSEKNYPRVVDNSMDYVLMFIPNESSYVAAIKLNPNLLRDAYAKKVIVISPNNLLMALQLALNMWQTDKQVKNLEKIVARGTALYEKVSGFQDTFNTIGSQIGKLKDAFDKANKQLSTGTGNVLRQCEMLREYGVKIDPKKQLQIPDQED